MHLLKPGKLVVGTLIGAMVLAGSSIASAADKPKKGDKKPKDPAAQFAKLDKDNNKVLTVSEMVGSKTGKKEEHARAAFKKRDRDGDGKLSLGEFTAEVEKKAKPKKAK